MEGNRRYHVSFRLVKLAFIIFSYLAEKAITSYYVNHGPEGQHLTFLVVVAAFISPLLAPILQIKNVLLVHLLPAEVEAYLVNTGGQWLLTPSKPFRLEEAGNLTDYSNPLHWACYGGRGDTGEQTPPDAKHCSDYNLCEAVDVFYLHPTTWYTSSSWNAPALHPVTQYLAVDAITPQQGNAFNVAGRIFAPLYRQMCAAGFIQGGAIESDENSASALAVAYSDVRAAFQYYLEHENKGRPIILAGHSQGSLLAEKLLHEFFHKQPLKKQLVAAYLIGWTVFAKQYEDPHEHAVTICKSKHDTGCVISWRTFGFGGDPSLFLHVEPDSPQDRRICTNPLSWKENDSEYISHKYNLGGLDLMHPRTMFWYLIGVSRASTRVTQPTKTESISDAQCKDGNLFVTKPSDYGYGWWLHPAWTFAMFPGQNLHPYDYNLFFYNIRQNTVDRVMAFLGRVS